MFTNLQIGGGGRGFGSHRCATPKPRRIHIKEGGRKTYIGEISDGKRSDDRSQDEIRKMQIQGSGDLIIMDLKMGNRTRLT